MSRATTCTPEIAAEICERLAEGEPLRAICRDEHMPAWRTFYDWVAGDKDFAARIAHARTLGYDALAEQCIDIADDETHDWVLTKKGEVTNEVAIGRAKLQVHTRLQLLAKWDPKRYGEKKAVELTGADGGPVVVDSSKRAARLASLVGLAAQRRASGSVEDLV